MTIDELKSQLKVLAGDNTSDEAMNAITNLVEDYGALAERAGRVEQLEKDLQAEKDRFKNRFWGGIETNDGKPSGGTDYGDLDIIGEFFKEV